MSSQVLFQVTALFRNVINNNSEALHLLSYEKNDYII